MLVALLGIGVLALGWRSLSTPARGVPVILALLPLLKTAERGGVLARFAPPDVFIFLTLLGTVVLLARRRDPGWRSVRVPLQVLVGLALFFPPVVLSFLASEDPGRSTVELVAYGVNAVLFGLVVFHVRSRENLLACMRAWEIGVVVAVVGAVVGVVLLLNGIVHVPLTEGPKVSSTFKKSGQLSAYLLPSLPILWFNLREMSATRRARILRRLLIAATYFAIVASGSRAGLVIGGVLIVGLFGGSWICGVANRRGLALASTGGLLLAFATPRLSHALDILPFGFRRAFSIFHASATLEQLSPTRYHQYLGWKVAAADYPWLGVGTGNFKNRATSLVPEAWTSHEVHNTYLGIWAETGLFGILALALFYLGVLRAAWQVVVWGDKTMSVLGLSLLIALLTLFLYGTSNFGLRMRHLWSIFGLIIAAWNLVTVAPAPSGAGTGVPLERECGA